MLHSVVQGHFLCNHCLLCIRSWGALYIVSVWCGLRNGLRIKRKQTKKNIKQRALLQKLGNHRSIRKRVTVSQSLSVPTERTLRPGHSVGYTEFAFQRKDLTPSLSGSPF